MYYWHVFKIWKNMEKILENSQTRWSPLPASEQARVCCSRSLVCFFVVLCCLLVCWFVGLFVWMFVFCWFVCLWSPVPALVRAQACCSRSLVQPPRTSDNCLQSHIRIFNSINFAVSQQNLPTFAVSISWTVVSRLAHRHHLFAALFAEAHLMIIRE